MKPKEQLTLQPCMPGDQSQKHNWLGRHLSLLPLGLGLFLFFTTTTSFAQSDKYVKGMEKNLVLLDSAKTA